MKVAFANGTLKRCANDVNRAKKAWKTQGVAQAYVDRIPVLLAIEQLDQLRLFPGFDFHALHGDRDGQYAITLKGLWRLVFEYDGDEDEIIIVEVKDYHP
ncbi:MAG: type II toxin-antitoxin system RelE/ParE family toxin [Chloroflexi bacterium]|nr:type II toxin-antitoxin system RelE/ParE family toxin [Chloroflexota bacterium]